jgi:hypothetical protein
MLKVRIRRRPVVFAAVLVTFVLMGCTKPDLRITDLSVDSYTVGQNGSISYSFTVENRDWGGNILVKPGSTALPVGVQAWTSKNGTLDNNSYARLAGGTSVGQTTNMRLEPGQSVSDSFSSSADINLSERPFFVLMVDHQDLRKEYNENNNIQSINFAP